VALGEAREAQGDTDGAADAFTRALELDPDAEFAPDAEGAATNGE
jgi:cytochrome c-type biogenesis protein CcmH/NrfG